MSIIKKKIILKSHNVLLTLKTDPNELSKSDNQLPIPTKVPVDTKLPPKFRVQLKKQQTLDEQFPMRRTDISHKDYSTLTAVEKGDNLVWWIYDLLKESPNMSEIANISGVSNNIFDLVFRLKSDNLLRGVQIKNIHNKISDSWETYIGDVTYPPNTLMIFMNFEKTRFGLIFWEEICSQNTFFLSFNKENTMYQSAKSTNINDFRKNYRIAIVLTSNWVKANISHCHNNIAH